MKIYENVIANYKSNQKFLYLVAMFELGSGLLFHITSQGKVTKKKKTNKNTGRRCIQKSQGGEDIHKDTRWQQMISIENV